MCRCRQPQRQASIAIRTKTNTPTSKKTPSSTSTSPAPTTPSPTPPPLQTGSFSYMKSFRNLHQETQQPQIHTPHYFYYQDSYSSSSSPPHEPSTIIAEALVHTSCSLPSLHHTTATSPIIQSIQTNSPSSTLSRSLTMMPTALAKMHANTQSVLEHCSCGLTFAVDHIVPVLSPIETNVMSDMALVDNDVQSSSAIETAYYETITDVPLTEQAHQHHSHHHGHIHYFMNSNEQTGNYKKQEQTQYQTEHAVVSIEKDHQIQQEQHNPHKRQQHHHYCQHSHNCQNIPDQSFVQ